MFNAMIVVFLGVCFFITIVNYSFQSEKYRGQPEMVKKRLNKFNSPTAWLTYSAILGIMVLVMIAIAYGNMIGGISNMGKLTNQSSGQTNSVDDQSTDE